MSTAKKVSENARLRKKAQLLALKIVSGLFMLYGVLTFFFSSSAMGRSEALLALIFSVMLVWHCRWLAEE